MQRRFPWHRENLDTVYDAGNVPEPPRDGGMARGNTVDPGILSIFTIAASPELTR
ncbi:MAG: hypothetical protein QM684_12940 [Rhizobium sp.]